MALPPGTSHGSWVPQGAGGPINKTRRPCDGGIGIRFEHGQQPGALRGIGQFDRPCFTRRFWFAVWEKGYHFRPPDSCRTMNQLNHPTSLRALLTRRKTHVASRLQFVCGLTPLCCSVVGPLTSPLSTLPSLTASSTESTDFIQDVP
jgi:hypothetical protein